MLVNIARRLTLRATTSPPMVKMVNIKNGLIYELSQVRKCGHTPWIAFYDSVKAICNTISERDFAKLDRLLREKPNATTLALEGIILFSNNKTARWLREKSTEDREVLFAKARKIGPEFKSLYKLRRKQLLEDRAKVLREKQIALQKLEEK